jgi:hypothetical protein
MFGLVFDSFQTFAPQDPTRISRILSPRLHGVGTLVEGCRRVTYLRAPLTLHIALVGPFTSGYTSRERYEDACLPPCCLCVYLRRLNMHDADQDIPAVTNGLQQLTPIASRFYSATACSMVARTNR